MATSSAFKVRHFVSSSLSGSLPSISNYSASFIFAMRRLRSVYLPVAVVEVNRNKCKLLNQDFHCSSPDVFLFPLLLHEDNVGLERRGGKLSEGRCRFSHKT